MNSKRSVNSRRDDTKLGIATRERRRITEELRRSQERYRALVETAFAGIGISDADENFTFVNRVLEEMLGYGQGELDGTNLSQLVDPTEFDRVSAFTPQRREEGLRNYYESTINRKDGNQLNVLVSCSPLTGADGAFQGTVAVVIDITELRQAQAEAERVKLAYTERLEETVRERTRRLEEAQAQLVQSTKMAAMGRLAAGVAHEINNPAGVLLMKLEFLLSIADSEALSPRAVSTLEIAVQQTRRIDQIVDNLLTFSRPSKGSVSAVDVNDVVRVAMQLSGRVLRSEGIQFEGRLTDGLPAVRGASTELEQVVINLINNSVDAMPGGGKLTVSTAAGEGEDQEVLIVVADTGVGISEEDVERIFDPFFTTKEVGKGTGLGLSISYGIVDKVGGAIEVDSAIERGTTMTVRLPVFAD